MGNIIEELPTIEQLYAKQKAREAKLSNKVKNPAAVLSEKYYMVFSFLFQNHTLMESKDLNLISKTSRRLGQYGFFVFIGSNLLNIYLAKITFNYIYSLPRAFRGIIRLALYAVPIGLFALYSQNVYNRVSLYMADKYLDRVELYMKYQDPRIMNPFLEEEKINN
jgi:hypothetical protein